MLVRIFLVAGRAGHRGGQHASSLRHHRVILQMSYWACGPIGQTTVCTV